jgi:hypothetical protein
MRSFQTGLLERFRGASPHSSGHGEAGWLIDTDHAGFIWYAPRPIRDRSAVAAGSKSVLQCPAVIDHESRIHEVPCPIDARLRFGIGEDGRPTIFDALGQHSSISPSTLSQLIVFNTPDTWRNPRTPVFQVSTPYRFISDNEIVLTQSPPFSHYQSEPWPGVVISGRFPIYAWPRKLSWAFEWHDTNKELVLRRGEPWFYIRLDSAAAGASSVRLIEAEMTQNLREYCSGLDGVVHYVNRTFSLFGTAKSRRPKKLLVPRQPSNGE